MCVCMYVCTYVCMYIDYICVCGTVCNFKSFHILSFLERSGQLKLHKTEEGLYICLLIKIKLFGTNQQAATRGPQTAQLYHLILLYVRYS
jgi:hypothetical protein